MLSGCQITCKSTVPALEEVIVQSEKETGKCLMSVWYEQANTKEHTEEGGAQPSGDATEGEGFNLDLKYSRHSLDGPCYLGNKINIQARTWFRQYISAVHARMIFEGLAFYYYSFPLPELTGKE